MRDIKILLGEKKEKKVMFTIINIIAGVKDACHEVREFPFNRNVSIVFRI